MYPSFQIRGGLREPQRFWTTEHSFVVMSVDQSVFND